MSTSRVVPVSNWQLGKENSPGVSDHIAAEVPVAMTYNRHSHVVMMATPADFEDFGLGFSLTEGLIGTPEDLLATRVIPRDGGVELAMTIADEWYDRLQTQRPQYDRQDRLRTLWC